LGLHSCRNLPIRAVVQVPCPPGLSDCYLLPDLSFRAVGQLEHLVVYSCVGLTHESIPAVAQCCPQLAHLHLSDCYFPRGASLRAVAQGCRQLEHLVLECCNLTDAAIQAVAKGCPQLKHLDLGGCGRDVAWRGCGPWRRPC